MEMWIGQTWFLISVVTKNQISYKLEAVDVDSWNQPNLDKASETQIII
jgi:hypothetical protein